MFERFLNRFRNYIIGGLLIGLGVMTLAWYVTDARLDACKSGREADRATYVAAQAQAEKLHIEAILKKEKEYAAKAKEADAAYGTLSSKYADAVRVYAAAQSKARATASAPYRGSAASPDRSSEAPSLPDGATYPELDITQVVVVPVNDLMICAENTARLVVARNWALGLNE